MRIQLVEATDWQGLGPANCTNLCCTGSNDPLSEVAEVQLAAHGAAPTAWFSRGAGLCLRSPQDAVAAPALRRGDERIERVVNVAVAIVA